VDTTGALLAARADAPTRPGEALRVVPAPDPAPQPPFPRALALELERQPAEQIALAAQQPASQAPRSEGECSAAQRDLQAGRVAAE
jgi:hypothetical protein